MNQTKLGSLIEVTINTFIGFIVSFAVWPVAAWMFTVEYNNTQHFGIVALFTFVSVLRS